MKKAITGTLYACVVTLGVTATTANASLSPRLGGQAYFDSVNNVTWAADANINGAMNWRVATEWVSGLAIGGVSGWSLPDKSYAYDFLQGLDSSNPFSNVMDGAQDNYWTRNEVGYIHAYVFNTNGQDITNKYYTDNHFAWAIHSGDVGGGGVVTTLATPVPAAAWLFGSGLLALLGVTKRRRQ